MKLVGAWVGRIYFVSVWVMYNILELTYVPYYVSTTPAFNPINPDHHQTKT